MSAFNSVDSVEHFAAVIENVVSIEMLEVVHPIWPFARKFHFSLLQNKSMTKTFIGPKCCLILRPAFFIILPVVQKNGYFTVRLAVRGVSPLGPGRKNMWNFDPFLNCLVLGYSKHTYLIVRGLKNAFIMSFTPLLYRYPTILWQSREQQQVEKEEMRILVVGWKFLFSCVKSVPERIKS